MKQKQILLAKITISWNSLFEVKILVDTLLILIGF
jgi:hypothetical protein